MDYRFDENIFKENFKVYSDESKSDDYIKLKHRSNNRFKLFPYIASGKKQAPIVYDLEEVVSGFFREALNKKTEPIIFDDLCDCLLEEVDVEEDDIDFFKDMIQSLFFRDTDFIADNIGLYPYQNSMNNRSVDNLAHFIFSVMDMNTNDCEKIETNKRNKCQFNVLEKMVIKTIENKNVTEDERKPSYFRIKNDIQELFKSDFEFMLESGMTSLEDLSNLFAVYYFFYVSQTCIILDKFCHGKRDLYERLYFALDWERVGKNRLCCTQGWERLQNNINNMFSHAITLEILNQTQLKEMVDYILIGELARDYNADLTIASEIRKAEEFYCSCIGDCKDLGNVPKTESGTETEKAIEHLFKCVKKQFLCTERKRADQFYNEKFSEFCKNRWVKNRKKSGLVLNLTERDVIFLTKVCLRYEEKIRLNDLFKEFEKRGINLDGTSREYLQEFFTKLNLIDKKSDSGDAQYVKRIL